MVITWWPSCRCSSSRACPVVLPAARAVLRAGRGGVDAGRALPHPGAVSAHALPQQADQPRVAAASRPQAGLPRRAGPLLRRPSRAFGAVLCWPSSERLPSRRCTQPLPNFKERAPHALANAAGTCSPKKPGVRRGLQGPAGDSWRAQLGPHIGQAFLPTRCTVSTSARTGSAWHPTSTTTTPWRRCRNGRCLPRSVPRRPDLSARADQGSSHRVE